MAEFLIYNKDHWMDALTAEQLDKYCLRYSKFMRKYEARHQRGDVIEVRPDGFWSKEKRYPRVDVFRVVLLRGMSVEEASQYLQPYTKTEFVLDENDKLIYDEEGNPKVEVTELKQCRYKILSGEGKAIKTVTSLSVVDKSLE